MVQKPLRPWQEVAHEAQAHRDASIAAVQPPVSSLPPTGSRDGFNTIRSVLSEQELAVTELLPEQLLRQIREQKYSAVDVTNAFLRRAGYAQKLVGVHSPYSYSLLPACLVSSPLPKPFETRRTV